jgi:Ulp1 family protease
MGEQSSSTHKIEKFRSRLDLRFSSKNFLDFDLLFFPVHSKAQNHWYLIILTKDRFIVLDSLPGSHEDDCHSMTKILGLGSRRISTQWDGNEIPKQMDGYNCGVKVCLYILCCCLPSYKCYIGVSLCIC